MVTYERIDENRIKEIKTVESEIYIDKLKKDIKELQRQINLAPKLKTEPDKETLDFWNAHIEDINPLKEELRKKQKILSNLDEI